MQILAATFSQKNDCSDFNGLEQAFKALFAGTFMDETGYDSGYKQLI